MQLFTAGECQHSASEMERTLRTRPSDAAIIARQRRPNPTRSMRPEGGTAKNDKPDQITEDSWEVTRPPRAQPGSDAGPSRIKQSSSSSPWREFYTEPQAALLYLSQTKRLPFTAHCLLPKRTTPHLPQLLRPNQVVLRTCSSRLPERDRKKQ